MQSIFTFILSITTNEWIAAGVGVIVMVAAALWWWLPKWQVNRLRLQIRDQKHAPMSRTIFARPLVSFSVVRRC
jgi:hypothetical protein